MSTRDIQETPRESEPTANDLEIKQIRAEVEIVHRKIDALIQDTRGTRLFQERTDRGMKELVEGQSRLEGAMLETLSHVQAQTKGMHEFKSEVLRPMTAMRAEITIAKADAAAARREAKALADKPIRESWTDEIAQQAAKTGIKVIADTNQEEIRQKASTRQRNNRLILGVSAAAILVLQTAFLTFIAHGCK